MRFQFTNTLEGHSLEVSVRDLETSSQIVIFNVQLSTYTVRYIVAIDLVRTPGILSLPFRYVIPAPKTSI